MSLDAHANPLDFGLTNAVVLLFGAGSSGASLSNGEAAALTYARAGAHVACIDRDQAEAERVAKAIQAEGGIAQAVTADVTVETDVAAAVSAAAENLGPPAVLHNNVGVAFLGEVLELERKTWDTALAVNLTGTYLTAKHALPHMLQRGKGAIVNVSSLAAIRHTGYPYPAYSAAKAAVNQLTVSLALTYADRGIRANAILPGLINTPLVAQQMVQKPEQLAEELAARNAASPTGQMGSPWDVAHAALFVASDLAAYVNGALIPVDGGLAARCV